jgi:hypothetical protein
VSAIRVRRHCLALLASLTVSGSAYAQHPFRGSLRWSVVLCRYMDSPAPTRGVTFYEDLFLRRGTGGLADYWAALSRNSVTTQDAAVRGWFTVPMIIDSARAKSGGPNPRRGQIITDCINAAQAGGYTLPSGQSVAVVTNPEIDLYGGGGRALVGINHDLGAFMHEVSHGLGLNHSFSDDPTFRIVSWAAIGEYDDPWDVMSWANVFGTPTPGFGFGGPAINGHHLDRMGWLPTNEIITFGADGVSNRTVTLNPLYGGPGGGVRLIRVPFDPGDPFRYYTVEFRFPTGWDAGIPASPLVLVRESRKQGGQYFSFLLRERTPARTPVQSLNANGVSIQVAWVNPTTQQAGVTISSEIVERCLQGFVWREAGPTDRVCVTPAVRQQTRDDNAAAASRRNPAGGPYGPNTCLQGFVWREASASDFVCVTPDVRARTREENQLAPSRRNPARFVYGPNACKQGFVWREADAMDYVCVPPPTRAETRQENTLAASRRNPAGGAYGPNTCLQGFVWREAFPGDVVCVLPPSRTRARADNPLANSRLMQN